MTRGLLQRLLLQPDDEAAWLVLADALAQEGDPAGELILTRHRLREADDAERPALSAALPRLEAATRDGALLAALFVDRPRLLAFRGGGAHPVSYDVTHDGKRYRFVYKHGALRLDLDGGYKDAEWPLAGADDGEWDAPTTTAVLAVLSQAIASGAPPTSWQLPTRAELPGRADFVPGPYPRLPVPACGRDHAHEWRCESERAMAAWADEPWRWLARRLG